MRELLPLLMLLACRPDADLPARPDTDELPATTPVDSTTPVDTAPSATDTAPPIATGPSVLVLDTANADGVERLAASEWFFFADRDDRASVMHLVPIGFGGTMNDLDKPSDARIAPLQSGGDPMVVISTASQEIWRLPPDVEAGSDWTLVSSTPGAALATTPIAGDRSRGLAILHEDGHVLSVVPDGGGGFAFGADLLGSAEVGPAALAVHATGEGGPFVVAHAAGLATVLADGTRSESVFPGVAPAIAVDGGDAWFVACSGGELTVAHHAGDDAAPITTLTHPLSGPAVTCAAHAEAGELRVVAARDQAGTGLVDLYVIDGVTGAVVGETLGAPAGCGGPVGDALFVEHARVATACPLDGLVALLEIVP